ncbi:MAG: hypothetical protein Q7V57_12640 [Actinomycetota bacterium]|nr:hypothetical protein [Actinomycetota bacterium]
MDLHLDESEAHLLREVLASYVKELRGEIIDTDNADYKRGLRAERDSLDAIAARLDHVPRFDDPIVTRVLQVNAIWI